MHHLPNFLKKVNLIFLSLLVTTNVRATPSELKSVTFVRTVQSAPTYQNRLLKNEYRQETYQETEKYYVDVPYQDTEEYTDYEDYYQNEYVCHNYTDYERQCRHVRECNNILFGERPPGTGPAPYPGPRPEPRPEPRPPQCYDREVCENIPVTRQRCGYESVRHTREVRRTREVTRYRREERTRQEGRKFGGLRLVCRASN